MYSTLCHDIAPFSDPSVPPGLDAAISEAYGKSPYLRLCDRWPVGEADPGLIAPIQATVPTLVEVGEFAPYTPVDDVRRGLAGFTKAEIVVVPGTDHPATSECLLDLRRTRLANPTPTPPPACVAQQQIAWEW